MIALKITHIKQFMNRLLAGEDFDSFLLEEASISTYNTFIIDGRQNRAFYSTEEWEDKEIRPYDFSTWKTVRPICFDLIKGRHTPVKAFVLNIKYDGAGLTLVTGTAFHTFLMDKTPDVLWDKAVRKFLYNKEIAYEDLT